MPEEEPPPLGTATPQRKNRGQMEMNLDAAERGARKKPAADGGERRRPGERARTRRVGFLGHVVDEPIVERGGDDTISRRLLRQGRSRTPGRITWFGRGAANTAGGAVDKRAFAQVLEGCPGGRRGDAFGPARQPAFRPPGPGSQRHLRACQARPDRRSEVGLDHGPGRRRPAHRRPARRRRGQNLRWIKDNVLETRVWDKDPNKPVKCPTNRMAATFRHDTSRNQDPQLHTHCVVANMTRGRNPAGGGRSRTKAVPP